MVWKVSLRIVHWGRKIMAPYIAGNVTKTTHILLTWISNFQFYVLFGAKTIYALFVIKTIFAIFGRKNDLRTSSGKFLRVESCHPESSDFLGLCLIGPFFADSLSPNQNQNIRISNMNFGTYFDQTCTLGTSDLFYPPVK